MITKHFLKTLVLFTVMIALGLLGVMLSSYFDQGEKQSGLQNSFNML